MPSYTPNYALPYPIASDSPCTLSDTWCAFDDAVETQLDAIDSVVARTATATPMAIVSTIGLKQYSNDPNVLGSNLVVTYDSVLVDTDGMTNLNTNPQGLTIQTAGIYLRWVYMTIRTTQPSVTFAQAFPTITTPSSGGIGPNQAILMQQLPLSTAMPVQNDRNRLYNFAFSSNQIIDMQANWSLSLTFNVGIPGFVAYPLFVTSQMGVAWLREAP
jgi:hypothetical protein